MAVIINSLEIVMEPAPKEADPNDAQARAEALEEDSRKPLPALELSSLLDYALRRETRTYDG